MWSQSVNVFDPYAAIVDSPKNVESSHNCDATKEDNQ